MKIALKGSNGLYVCAEGGGNDEGIVHVNRSAAKEWETWEVIGEPGNFGLKSVNGRFLCAESGGGGDVHANRLGKGIWESYDLVGSNGFSASFAIKTFDGNHYLRLDSSRSDFPLDGRGTQPNGAGTQFTAEILEGATLPRVYREGLKFTTGGRAYFLVGSTELLLGWRYDTGGADSIREVLQQRKDVGFNNLRVLWQKDINNTGHSAWQMPLDKLKPFLSLCGEYGFYIQGTILADCQIVNPNAITQGQRVQDVRRATEGVTNLFEQLGNEYDKNGHNPEQFSKPTDRLAANSSSTEGGKDAPYWDYFCFSGQRGPLNHAIREYGPIEFMYSDGHPWGGVPAICDEGMKPGVNSSDPYDYYRAGAQSRSGCGGRFHSVAGTGGNSSLFNSLELESAIAFVEGLAYGK